MCSNLSYYYAYFLGSINCIYYSKNISCLQIFTDILNPASISQEEEYHTSKSHMYAVSFLSFPAP